MSLPLYFLLILARGDPVLFLVSFTATTGVTKFSLFLGWGWKLSRGSNFFWPLSSWNFASHLALFFWHLKYIEFTQEKFTKKSKSDKKKLISLPQTVKRRDITYFLSSNFSLSRSVFSARFSSLIFTTCLIFCFWFWWPRRLEYSDASLVIWRINCY